MANERNERSYKVLMPVEDPAGEQTLYADLGNFAGANAEGAVTAALEMPDRHVKTADAIAVPVGNWNECEVEEDPRPRFKVRRRVPERQPQPGDSSVAPGEFEH